MNTILNPLGLAVFLLMTIGFNGWSQGVLIWDGPVISFIHTNNAGTSVQDHLTPSVWLTRDLSQGLINVAPDKEVAYTHNLSPQDTEWAYGSLTDYATLNFTTWEQLSGGKPPDMVGQPAVVYLIAEKIYLSLTFTSWGGTGGAFSYDRSTPSAVPEPSVAAICGLSVFLALAVVARRKNSRTV